MYNVPKKCCIYCENFYDNAITNSIIANFNKLELIFQKQPGNSQNGHF